MAFRIEAESFSRDVAFKVKSLAPASANQVLQADGSGEQRASYVFDRSAGTYALTIGYFDENDGVSSFGVFVDGVEIDNWLWDEDLGSAFANNMTATTRTITGVQINQGEAIEVVGMKDGGEPLRFDFVDFAPLGADVIAPEVVNVMAPDIGLAQAGTASTEISVTYSDNVALDVLYFDIDDIRVTGPRGIDVDVIGFSVDTPSDGTPRTVTYTIEAPGLTWDPADNGFYSISLEALEVHDTSFNAAQAIVDLASFTVAIDDQPPPPSFRIEAENFTRDVAFQVKSLAPASGDQVLQAEGQGEQRASYVFNRPTGTYELTIGYFDENDGVSSFGVFVDDVEIDNWLWDEDLGSAFANNMTATTHTIQGVNINMGDVIEVAGMKDGGEPLRFDYVDFAGASGVETIIYDPFLSELPNVEMEVRRGQDIALLTPLANADRYDDDALDLIVDALDEGWNFYRQITGREPALLAGRHIDGLGTIAVVERTCGAGCAFLGLTGIEIWAQPYFNEWMHDNVRDNNQYDQILFYELGRNFWFYSDQIGAMPINVPVTFAVANRYFAIEAAGLDPAPHDNSIPYDALRDELLDDLSQYYLQDPALDWSNTIDVNDAPDIPGGMFDWDGSGLLVSFHARVMEDFGQEVYGEMWQTIGTAAATNDPDIAADTYLNAASSASGIDYGFLRKEGGEVFVIGDSGDNQLQAPAATPGARLIMHGFAGDDHVVGGNGDEFIFGGAGNDHLEGRTLVGGTGDDLLEGGSDNHELFGGPGSDTFSVGNLVSGRPWGWSDVRDYEPGIDVIDLGGYSINWFSEHSSGVEINFGPDTDHEGAGDTILVHGITDFRQITFVNTPAPPSPIRVEAEDFMIDGGFVVSSLGGASGGQVLKAGDAGQQLASINFPGPSGPYDVVIGYYDENDGEASFQFTIEESQIVDFVWDQDLGSPLANSMTKTTREIDDVPISNGDIMQFYGFGDAGEPLRIDYVDFIFIF
ncbi:hypothetical protein [Parasedimentitalea psychrophila]|uniref:Calcium-binding protein n=1 Tax=Parasedimentitalea psychrophila TaxID=2997337 RepID=A0A9Y2L0A5_9RHOB|nr:hypothetical protein [Parasedimentitalea psychrophila]WIY24484.1 hypothetical protein QPJ95_18300 [Parasedimentitalea psychrophila]